MPWTPTNTRSTWTVRRAATANGPTSASDGVRTPPVRMIVWSVRPTWWRTSATRIELVTTVSPGTSARRWASAYVVVPAETPMAMPGSTSAAAASAIASFSACWSEDLAAKPGLEEGAAEQRRRPAVDLLEQAALVEDLEVAADGHVGHAELADQVGDADGPVLADALEDEGLTLPGEHHAPPLRIRPDAVRHAHLRHRSPLVRTEIAAPTHESQRNSTVDFRRIR